MTWGFLDRVVGRGARTVVLAATVVLLTVSCTSPGPPAPGDDPPTPPAVQPPPAAQRAVEGFVGRPCDLLRPEQYVAEGLEDMRVASSGPPVPDGVFCYARRDRPDSTDGPDDVLIGVSPGEDRYAFTIATATAPDVLRRTEIAGLPAVQQEVAPGSYPTCLLAILTAPGQSLEVSVARYPIESPTGDTCDVARRLAESAIANLPRYAA